MCAVQERAAGIQDVQSRVHAPHRGLLRQLAHAVRTGAASCILHFFGGAGVVDLRTAARREHPKLRLLWLPSFLYLTCTVCMDARGYAGAQMLLVLTS